MKKISYIFIVLVIFLVSCSSNQGKNNAQIQQQLETQVKKQMDEMVALTLTAIYNAVDTPVPTTIATPTLTAINTLQSPQFGAIVSPANGYESYTLEVGYCDVGAVIVNNPKDAPGCVINENGQAYIEDVEPGIDTSSGEFTWTIDYSAPNHQVFCSLYLLDGTYILSEINPPGEGILQCHPGASSISTSFPTETVATLQTYVVQDSDTCMSIAIKFNITVQELIKINALPPESECWGGMYIKVPSTFILPTWTPTPQGFYTYIAKETDTCDAIADASDMSIENLLEVSNLLLSDCDNIAGKKFLIPLY